MKALPTDLQTVLAALPPAQRAAFLTDAVKEYKRQKVQQAPPMTFSEFKHRFWLGYKPAPYDPAIDAVLQGIADYVLSDGERGIPRAMLFLPPRSGKTQRVRLFAAWMLSLKPDLQIITASYGMRLSEINSRWVRNLLLDPMYQEAFPHVRLLGQASDLWGTSEGGGMLAAGVLGAITGFGTKLGIIDDPTKSRAESESALIRERVKEWYNTDWLSRIENPGGAQLLIGTRYHQDDIFGYLLSSDEDEAPADQWRVLSLPAIAEENDAIGREPGQALWPERYPIAWLLDRKEKMGQYNFSSLYQQAPIPSAGGIFKYEWFTPLLDHAPVIVQKVRFFDLAMSEKTTADYTCGVLMGIDAQGHFYILDVIRKRVDMSNLVAFLAIVILADGPEVKQGIENKGYMSRAIQDLNRDPRLFRHQIRGYPAEGDKLTRSLPFAARCEAGLVHILSRHWTQTFLEEIGSFPYAPHDDQVDGANGAFQMIQGPALKKLTVEVLRYA